MAITHITSLAQLNAILDKSPLKLTVIDFHAAWCGPCRAIARRYEDMAKQYTNVNFLKCDVDAAHDVSDHYSIETLPTFTLLKGQTKVEQLTGTNMVALENAIRRHSSGSTPASAAFSGRGQSIGGSSAVPPRPRKDGSDAPVVYIDP